MEKKTFNCIKFAEIQMLVKKKKHNLTKCDPF